MIQRNSRKDEKYDEKKSKQLRRGQILFQGAAITHAEKQHRVSHHSRIYHTVLIHS